MFVGFLIFILCVLACVFIPKEDEALPLYYDAEVTEGQAHSTLPTTSSLDEFDDNVPIPEAPKKVTLRVGGSVVNEDPTRVTAPKKEGSVDDLMSASEAVAPKKDETLEDLMNASKAADPNTMRAQNLYDDLRRGGL